MAPSRHPREIRQMRQACNSPHYNILDVFPIMRENFLQAEAYIALRGMWLDDPDSWVAAVSMWASDPDMTGIIYWTLHMQRRHGNAVWKLDKRTAMSLALTDPPDDNLAEGLGTYLAPPYQSLYLMIPRDMGLSFRRPDASGTRTISSTVEGVYITRSPSGSLILTGVFNCTRKEPIHGYSHLVISESDHEFNSVKNIRQFFRNAGEPDMALMYIIAINFLYALNAGYLSVSSRDPEQRNRRRRRKGLKAMAKTKAASKSMTFVSLNRKAAAAEKDRRTKPKSTRAGRTNYWVRGHWHGYWVKQPGEEPVLAERVNKAGTTLYLIKKLIPAYIVGDPDLTGPPKYRSNPRLRMRDRWKY